VHHHVLDGLVSVVELFLSDFRFERFAGHLARRDKWFRFSAWTPANPTLESRWL